MSREIERKFLLRNTDWKHGVVGERFCQGYADAKSGTFRVRIAGENAWLTIKTHVRGCSRLEFEYGIPVDDALQLLENVCEKPYIVKTRYKVEYEGMVWEIDEFEGENAGLTLAEIELESEDQPFSLPGWIGMEVTHDPRYYNSRLAVNPYSSWKDRP